PENLSALAWVLVPDEAARASSEASRESLGLAIAAVELRPNDMFTQLTLCRAALAAGDTGWFRRGVLGLERVAPDMAETHYVRALLAGGEGRLDEARRALEEARRRGLSDVQYRGLRDGLDEAQPFTERWLPTALVAVAVWLGGLALLLLLLRLDPHRHRARDYRRRRRAVRLRPARRRRRKAARAGGRRDARHAVGDRQEHLRARPRRRPGPAPRPRGA